LLVGRAPQPFGSSGSRQALADLRHNVPVFAGYVARSHRKTDEQLFTIRISNYERADAAILSLASLFLASSISFLKDIVSPQTAVGLPLVVVSWFLLLVSVGCVLLSFRTAQKATESAEELAYRYYVKKELNALEGWEEKIPQTRQTIQLNLGVGLSFLLPSHAGCSLPASTLSTEAMSLVRSKA
jgi:hypothetical protein